MKKVAVFFISALIMGAVSFAGSFNVVSAEEPKKEEAAKPADDAAKAGDKAAPAAKKDDKAKKDEKKDDMKKDEKGHDAK